MKQLLLTISLFVIISLFNACSNTANESGTNTATEKETHSSFDLASAKKAIDSTNAIFGDLVSKGDSIGIANLYHSEAKMLGANMPSLSGKAAIQSGFNGMLNSGIAGAKLTSTEVWGTEAMVAEEGTYSLTAKDGKEIDKGKYIVLWKMEDGKWKLFRDCFNSDLPCPCPTK